MKSRREFLKGIALGSAGLAFGLNAKSCRGPKPFTRQGHKVSPMQGQKVSPTGAIMFHPAGPK